MPLTPTDVANKQFRIAFRGYSLDEVDAFLDEVENELSTLLRDNNELRNRASSASPAATPAPAAAAPAPAPAQAQAPVGMEGQEAALRTLLLAQRTADEAIAEARAEAEDIVAAARREADEAVGSARAEVEKARGEADRSLAAARAEAERTLSAAREKAAGVEKDVAARIEAATGDLDARRKALESRIEELRAFEREYRTRLKAYLENQLRELGSGAGPDDSGNGVPAGARSAAVGLTPGGAAGVGGSSDTPAPGPVPVPGPGGPGPAPSSDVPDGPPREPGAPSALRAVPPLQSGSAPVGPFTVVPAGDSSGDEGEDAPAGR